MATTSGAGRSSRERRRERTRRDLLRAAVTLFDEKGFAATRVEEIADAADYSASTFFRLFPRKEDVVFADLEEKLVAVKRQLMEDRPADWATIRAAFVHHAEAWEAEDPEFAAARVRLFHNEPALTNRYLEYCLQWEDALAVLIADKWPDSEDRELLARLAAGAVVVAYRTAFRVQVERGGSLAAILEHTLKLLERGRLGQILGKAS